MKLITIARSLLLTLAFFVSFAKADLIPFVPPIAGTIDKTDILATETYEYTNSPTNDIYYYDFYLDVFAFTNTTGADVLLEFIVTPGPNSGLNPWLATFAGLIVPGTDHSWAAYFDGLPLQPDFYDIMTDSEAGTGPGLPTQIHYLLGAGDTMQLVITTTEYYQITENGLHIEGPNEFIFGDYVLKVLHEVPEPSTFLAWIFALFFIARMKTKRV